MEVVGTDTAATVRVKRNSRQRHRFHQGRVICEQIAKHALVISYTNYVDRSNNLLSHMKWLVDNPYW